MFQLPRYRAFFRVTFYRGSPLGIGQIECYTFFETTQPNTRARVAPRASDCVTLKSLKLIFIFAGFLRQPASGSTERPPPFPPRLRRGKRGAASGAYAGLLGRGAPPIAVNLFTAIQVSVGIGRG